MPRRGKHQPGRLKRRRGEREAAATFLIVCGGKTEEHYLKGLCRELRLSSAVTVLLAIRNPTGVVARVNEEDAISEEPFDHAWAVFDRDNFDDFDDIAANGRPRKRKSEQIGLAYSNPRFELWLLLHHRAWTADCTGKGVEREFRKQPCCADYKHGDNVFPRLKDKVQTAVQNAENLTSQREGDGRPPHDCPSTRVHMLVRALVKEAQKRKA